VDSFIFSRHRNDDDGTPFSAARRGGYGCLFSLDFLFVTKFGKLCGGGSDKLDNQQLHQSLIHH
jgi:hypothetical protein